MLGKMLIFAFAFVGIFALIMGTMPQDFVTAGNVYNPSYREATIEDVFEANNMVMYDSSASDNMTYQYESVVDAPSPPQWTMGLPPEDYVNVMWISVWWAGGVKGIGIRLVHRHWFLSYSWYTISDESTFFSVNGTRIGGLLELIDLEGQWSDDTNSSAFVMKMDVITSNFVIKRYDIGQTLAQNWDDGHLNYYITYDVNMTRSTLSAFTIIGNLLSWSTPTFGISGPWGSFMSSLIAIPMWACIAYIMYKVIAGLIPWLSGGSGD